MCDLALGCGLITHSMANRRVMIPFFLLLHCGTVHSRCSDCTRDTSHRCLCSDGRLIVTCRNCAKVLRRNWKTYRINGIEEIKEIWDPSAHDRDYYRCFEWQHPRVSRTLGNKFWAILPTLRQNSCLESSWTPRKNMVMWSGVQRSAAVWTEDAVTGAQVLSRGMNMLL